MPREVIKNGYKGSGVLSGSVYFALTSSDVEGFADASVAAFNDRAARFSRSREPMSVFGGFFEDCRGALLNMNRSADELVSAGFYASGTHRIASVERCALQPEIFGDIVEFVCALAEKRHLSVYCEESGEGLLRHLYLRTSSGDKPEISVCFVINGDELPGETVIASEIMQAFPCVVGVTVNTNTRNTNVILGDKYRTVSGRSEIYDTFCGVRLEISPAAFYQVNHDAAELLCRKAATLASLSGSEHLYDLYCGIGTVGLSMANKTRRITGVEIVPEAVECARRNAIASGLSNATFVCADSGDGVIELLNKADSELPDVVIVDPPRKGCTEQLLDALTNASSNSEDGRSTKIEKIVYISCNPATLARDCAYMRSLGWNIGEVHPVDLFPGTGHVESVVCLTRR
jgi:23S rRNA (uracil1939-C5)-methyltransferase